MTNNVKLGRPAPGTSRQLTTNEALATGLPYKNTTVAVSKEGRVTIHRSSFNGNTYEASSQSVEELVAYWATKHAKAPAKPSEDHRVATDYPARKIIKVEPGRLPSLQILTLECGHTHQISWRSRNAKPNRTKHCSKCPKEKKHG